MAMMTVIAVGGREMTTGVIYVRVMGTRLGECGGTEIIRHDVVLLFSFSATYITLRKIATAGKNCPRTVFM